jgi:hypothetical protein
VAAQATAHQTIADAISPRLGYDPSLVATGHFGADAIVHSTAGGALGYGGADWHLV